MKIVFVHQNFPGQFGRLASIFAAEGHQVFALGTVKTPRIPGVSYHAYEPVPGPDPAGYENRFNPVTAHLRRAYGVAHLARRLKEGGLEPDLVVVNTGWGESLFLKDVWPNARHVAYFEYYYAAKGQDVDFDPEFPIRNEETIWRLRLRNAMQLAAFDVADAAVTPTRFQRDTFPAYLRDRIAIIHDGIDIQALQPDPGAAMRVGENGPHLSRAEPVVTYATRHIEPMRGSHVVFRALPGLLDLDPRLRVVIIGGNSVSYSARPPEGTTWSDVFRSRIAGPVDWTRVHFAGQLPYPQFIRVLQLSAVHLYLTYPFVLSWSLIEAMALECRIVASATPPVEEVIRPHETGLLFPFFDEKELVAQVHRVLQNPGEAAAMARRARVAAVERFDFRTATLPRWREFLGVPAARSG
ncbi:glycosyltransferase [Microvirga massiliensis]|uniref:glycosyltransferase n=1 Tax=Microvirga massiliensis TaxID=1033741 RepID=UPI00062B5197|nr:glycosyltransferase [Microvirga massiliensis]